MFAPTVLLLRNLQALMFIHSCLLLGLRFHMCTASTVAKEQVRVANDGRFPSELWDVPLKGEQCFQLQQLAERGLSLGRMDYKVTRRTLICGKLTCRRQISAPASSTVQKAELSEGTVALLHIT